MSKEIVPREQQDFLESLGKPSRTDELRLRDIDFTDLYLGENGDVLIRGTADANGPLVEIAEEYLSDLHALRLKVINRGQNLDEFYEDFDGIRYRVSVIRSIEGLWYTLRKSKSRIPRLKELGGFSPPMIKHLAWLGTRSGLVLLAGATGQGKTTTAYSLLQEYLMAFGDVAVTIEDPPEMALDQSRLPFGKCFQLDLKKGETFGDALVKSMRYTPKYIFIGELRKSKDASEALRAAASGHLIITTIHAGSVPEAISSFIKLAASGDEGLDFVQDQVASTLAAVIHQKLTTYRVKTPEPGIRKRLLLETLFTGSDNGIRTVIREGHLSRLGTHIQQQATRMTSGQDPVDIGLAKTRNGR